MAKASGTVFPSAMPCTSPTMPPTTSLALTEKPSSFGSWPTRIVRAMPFM